jgi:acyl-CoA thioesterase FadM
MPRFVTASLKIDYRSPTPVGKEVELRATVEEIAGRKVRVSVSLSTDGTVHARGELLMIQLKES